MFKGMYALGDRNQGHHEVILRRTLLVFSCSGYANCFISQGKHYISDSFTGFELEGRWHGIRVKGAWKQQAKLRATFRCRPFFWTRTSNQIGFWGPNTMTFIVFGLLDP